MAKDKPETWKSKKFISMWVIEAVLTIFVGIGLYHHASGAQGWATIMQIWVNFTIINVLGYFTANVVRHGQYQGWAGVVSNKNKEQKESNSG